MLIINLNRSNVRGVNGQANPNNNTMVFTLDQNIQLGQRNEIALAQLNINYSFPSVDSINCGFTLNWIDGTNYTVNYPRGTTQSASTLNDVLKSVMEANLLYLNSPNGPVYYANIVENGPYYALQYNAWPIPVTGSLPVGWSIPAGALWGLPAATPLSWKLPRITIAPNNEFSELTGIAAGAYPTDVTLSTPYSKLSDIAPDLSPQSAINVLCSVVNNNFSTPTDQIATVPIGNVAYGQQISYLPPNLEWLDLKVQNIREIVVTLLDVDYNPLWILDVNYTVKLIIRDKI